MKSSVGRGGTERIVTVFLSFSVWGGRGVGGGAVAFREPGVPLPHSFEILAGVMSYSSWGEVLCSVCAMWCACQFSTHVRRNCVIVMVAVFVASVRERPPVMSWSINHCGGAIDAMFSIVMCSCDREEIHDLVRVSRVE